MSIILVSSQVQYIHCVRNKMVRVLGLCPSAHCFESGRVALAVCFIACECLLFL